MSKLQYTICTPSGLQDAQIISNSTRLVLVEAQKHGVEWEVIPDTRVIVLKHNGVERYFHNQIPPQMSALGLYICTNKQTVSALLKRGGLQAPKGYFLARKHDKKQLEEIYGALQKPLVVKPTNGTWGANITLNINTLEKFRSAVALASSYSLKKSAGVRVEEMFEGTEYRILATQEKVIGILRRDPAYVIGDGTHTIAELIAIENQKEIRTKKGHHTSHVLISIDDKLERMLADQDEDLDSVPKENEKIVLREVSNVSKGGEAVDVTDKAHPSVRELALKAVRALPGVEYVGIDFMTKDITAQQTSKSYVIIEVNDSPGFDIHESPYKGRNRHPAREFFYLLFPELRNANQG